MADSPVEVNMDASPLPSREVSIPPLAETAPEPVAPARALPKPRPKIDLTAGKKRSVFGQVLGTLNKAKIEDKERSASEAAKKRAITEERLQKKLSKETTEVRRQEEARRDRVHAGKREDELAVKGSIIRARMNRLPLLANFLLTSDPALNADTPMDDDRETTEAGRAILIGPPRQHPPPLYFLPAKLLDSQKAWLERRKREVDTGLRAEWKAWVEERTTALEEIVNLRSKASEASVTDKAVFNSSATKGDKKGTEDTPMDGADKPTEEKNGDTRKDDDVKMDDEHDPPGKESDERVEY